MEPTTTLVIVLVVLVLLLLIEVPIAFALALSGILGLMLGGRGEAAMAALGSAPYSSAARYALAVIPMYILLGMLAFHARVPEKVYTCAARAFARVSGGLGVATVAACAGFAAVSGSSVATAATVARLSVSEMRRHGYPKSFASGIVASAGTLGMMIPPSIILVMYAIITRESVGAMLVAGIVPGVISAIIYGTYIAVRARSVIAKAASRAGRSVEDALTEAASAEADTPAQDAATVHPTPAGGPAAAARQDDSGDVTPAAEAALLPWRELPLSGVVQAFVLFMIVLVGIYTGIVTITESGGMAVVVAFILLLVVRRRDGFGAMLQRVALSLRDAAATTSMTLSVLVGASIFAFYLIAGGLPGRLAAWIGTLDVPPLVIVAAFLLLMIPLGMFLESLSILLIVMPLAYPTITALGFDGVWFGILAVKMIELGMITPPIGLNVYVVAEAVEGVDVEQVFRGVAPFAVLDLLTVVLLFFVPQLVLWLPGMVG